MDHDTGSKPEHETSVGDPAAVDATLRALGYQPTIAFTKQCENFRFVHEGRDILATVVTVPELDGTYLEVETLVAEPEVAVALAELRAVLKVLGIAEADLTTELYTDAVAARRSRQTVPDADRPTHGPT